MEFVFSNHAAERWLERFPDKDFNLTMNGMRKARKTQNGQKHYRNNGVTMIVRDGLVVTVY